MTRGGSLPTICVTAFSELAQRGALRYVADGVLPRDNTTHLLTTISHIDRLRRLTTDTTRRRLQDYQRSAY
eukprot:1568362-Rhodomonas_salina.1